MNVKNNSNFIQLERLFYGLVLLVISPIVGVFASLRNFNFKESRFILFLFFGIFGMSMIIGEGNVIYCHILCRGRIGTSINEHGWGFGTPPDNWQIYP